jgi:hypothetical protein
MAALMQTETFWRDWSSHFEPYDEWAEPLLRSLITLKALTFSGRTAVHVTVRFGHRYEQPRTDCRDRVLDPVASGHRATLNWGQRKFLCGWT